MARTVNLGQIVPNIQIGETTTTPPSSSASVVNVGTELNPILNFSIPQGSAGADAKINGVNTLSIEAGTNISIDQQGSTLTINSTGGSGGTSDYSDLTNKPQINSVTLSGNKSLSDLGIQPAGSYLTSETDPVFSASASAGITSSDITNWNNKSDFSGNYNDLSNKPTIPTVPTNVSAFTNDAGYTTNTGTITSVKMNGTTVSSSGEANLGTVITSHQDISGKEDKTNKVTSLSSSSTDTQYPSAKCVYDMIGDVETILTRLTTGSGV